MATRGRELSRAESSRRPGRFGGSQSRSSGRTIICFSAMLSQAGTIKPSNQFRRRFDMCITCGCDEPEANHGNPKHITLQQLKDAAQAAEVDINQLKKNIDEGLKKYAGAQ